LILLVAFTLLLFTGQVGAQTAISLDYAKTLAREWGSDLQLLDLSKSQAGLGLAIARSKTGMGAYYDSRVMKKDIENLEKQIEGRKETISLLEGNIAQWEEEKKASGADIDELEKQIEQACLDINTYKDEIADIQLSLGKLIPRYHAMKSDEDMVKPQLKPFEDTLDQLTDALAIQPKLVDYFVEQLYLSLLAFDRQDELLTTALQIAERTLEKEKLQQTLGMSTPLQVQAAEENLLQSKEALQSLKAALEDCSKNFLYLLGLSLDFKFELTSLNLEKEYPDVNEDKRPDFTKSVACRRAYKNLEDAREDLDDTSRFEENEYQLAEVKVEEAELQLQKILEELEINYLSKKEGFQVTESTVEKAALSLEQAKQTYAAVELQHELGMISLLDLEGAKVVGLQAELAHFSALVQRQLAYQACLLAREGIEMQP